MEADKSSPPLGLGSSEGLGAWVPAHERVPATGTECVVLLRYSLDRPPFVSVDTWDVQREDPTGMGFGAAALSAARRSRVTPGTVDGAAVGARVEYNIRFRPPPPE